VKVLVFMKQVADTEARIIISSDQKSLEVENKYVVNFFDEFAVEEAIRIKEMLKDVEITVCAFAPQRAVEALRTTIAMGADRAFLINSTDREADDPLIVSRVLAGFARKEGFDIVLCGRQAMDDESANVGPMVAEFLGIPHVSQVTKLTITGGGKAEVESEIEGGKRTSEVSLPALFTCQKGLNEPRVPLITGVMRAMKTQIDVLDPASIEMPFGPIDREASKITVLSYEAPAGRPSVRIMEGASPEEKVQNLVRALKDEAKVL
jgi:electron transfer flavoprotein beta subunit